MADGHIEILEKLTEILVSQATMNNKQDNMHEDIGEIKTQVKEQNGRVGKLEKWQSKIIGIGSFVIIVSGLLIKFM